MNFSSFSELEYVSSDMQEARVLLEILSETIFDSDCKEISPYGLKYVSIIEVVKEKIDKNMKIVDDVFSCLCAENKKKNTVTL